MSYDSPPLGFLSLSLALGCGSIEMYPIRRWVFRFNEGKTLDAREQPLFSEWPAHGGPK